MSCDFLPCRVDSDQIDERYCHMLACLRCIVACFENACLLGRGRQLTKSTQTGKTEILQTHSATEVNLAQTVCVCVCVCVCIMC